MREPYEVSPSGSRTASPRPLPPCRYTRSPHRQRAVSLWSPGRTGVLEPEGRHIPSALRSAPTIATRTTGSVFCDKRPDRGRRADTQHQMSSLLPRPGRASEFSRLWRGARLRSVAPPARPFTSQQVRDERSFHGFFPFEACASFRSARREACFPTCSAAGLRDDLRQPLDRDPAPGVDRPPRVPCQRHPRPRSPPSATAKVEETAPEGAAPRALGPGQGLSGTTFDALSPRGPPPEGSRSREREPRRISLHGVFDVKDQTNWTDRAGAKPASRPICRSSPGFPDASWAYAGGVPTSAPRRNLAYRRCPLNGVSRMFSTSPPLIPCLRGPLFPRPR